MAMPNQISTTPSGLASLRLLALAFLLLVAHAGGRANAQQPPQFGTHFLVVFPDTTKAFIGPFVSPLHEDAELIFFANTTTHVTVTAPGYSQDLTVTPDSARTLWVVNTHAPKPFIDTLNTPTPNVFEIKADGLISVTCYYVTHSGCEAFVPFPVESWESEYYAMSLRTSIFQDVAFTTNSEEVPFADEAPSQIVVIASEPNTDVTVHATTPLAADGTGSTTDTTLHLGAGQAVLLESARPWRLDSVTRDISGTRITANKPVGVITGNTRTQGGVGANTIATATGNSGNSSAVEWLMPLASQGTTFVYRPVMPVAPNQTEEFIRVYATAPGTTTVSLSNGLSPMTIQQGEFLTYSYSLLASKVGTGSFNAPFAIRTDKPAQAMVITGSFDQAVPPTTVGEQTVETWAPAMSTLPPREGWINSARFHAPLYPPYLQHYLVVTADSGSQLWVDGVQVPFDPAPVPNAPFQHVRVSVTGGDHALRCIKGRCAAIAYGLGKGVESYMPPATRKKDDAPPVASAGPRTGGPAALHPSIYSELISVAYAYPVAGIAEEALAQDSVDTVRVERCDSTVVTLTRTGPAWTFVPYDVVIDPASVNTDVAIVQIWGGTQAGYTIRFRPLDPAADATAKVTLTNAAGRQWEIPYSYKAHTFAVSPDPVELLDVATGELRLQTLTFTNQKPFSDGVVSLRLKNGAAGFSLRDLSGVGSLLRPGESIDITLAFTGIVKNAAYIDTIVVVTNCGTFYIPVRAHTGPSPVPEITGKDWGNRLVGSANDTISILSNAGSLPYLVREVLIEPNPSNAFALVAPGWRSVAAVAPGERYPAGIEFKPPAMGTFVGTILLITTDNDTARAELRGVGIEPLIGTAGLSLQDLCAGRERDTVAVVTNNGNGPLRISSLSVAAGAGAGVAIDTVTPFLPRTLLPGESISIGLKITPVTPGPLTATIVLHSDAFGGDSVVAITGTIATCVKPRLTIDDHDFDSVLITLTKPGFVTIHNLGVGDATVETMTLAEDTASAFAILSPVPPFVVKDGDSVRVACTFTPRSTGLKTARIDVATDAGPLTSHLRGVGRIIIVPALIRRDYHAQPGQELTVYVELKGRLDTLPVQRLDIVMGYRPELLDFLAAQPDSAAKHGWRFFGAPDADSLRYTIDVAGAPPDTGALLSIRMLTRFNELDHSELPLRIEAGLPYLEIVESPGLFTRDPLCGLQERLFTFQQHNFRLEQNIPNPLNGAGSIDFEIPFASATTLIVYDALGREMARLVDQDLAAGAYTAYIAAGTFPAGLYYYRLRSGELTAIRTMIVE